MKPSTPSTAVSVYLFLITIELNMAQNPFYGNQTPPPYNDQNSDSRQTNDQNNSNNYNRYNSDSNNRYNSDTNAKYDPNNRYSSDPYNRNNDSNNRYNDPYNRREDTNRYNDPYNRHNDSNRYNDPYSRHNDSNRYNDPYNRNNDSNRYNDPYNRYNDSNRYNDPNNRYHDPNSRYNQDNRYNQDLSNRYNQDQYNRYNVSNRPYDLGSDLNPNYRNNDRYNTQYNQDNNSRYNRYNTSNNNYGTYSQDPNNRYNTNNNYSNNQYDPYNRNNDPYNRNNQQNQDNNRNQFNQGNRQYDSGFGNPYQNSNGQQYGSQSDPNDNCCEEYCYRLDENPVLYFGSKTAYQIVYGKRAHQEIPECKPVQIWSINRHGTRFPTEQEVRRLKGLENLRMEILKNYDDRRSFPYKGRLCNQDLDLLRRWRWNDTLSTTKEKVLTSQGIEDAKFLARRYKSKFGNLLNQAYRENYYNFQYDTSDYKTHDTYQAYIEGLFDLNKSFMVHANTDLSERILPPGYCKTWSREVENNNYTYVEYERFKQRQDYLQMVRDVYKRLGFRYTLNEAIVRDMYDMCRYEKAWYLNDPSPWCSVFTKKQLEMLEYAEDLQDYYHSGYGREQNAKVGCLLVKDMYEMMKKVVNGEPADAYKVSYYFTHSTQFLRFLTALGIAKDYTQLTADNFYQQKNRQWKLSVIDPFGANLVAVLYNCQRDNKFKIMFLLNEVPVNFPECSVGLCDWNTVEQKIRPIADNCNKEYCERGRSSSLHHSIQIVPTLILALYIFELIPLF